MLIQNDTPRWARCLLRPGTAAGRGHARKGQRPLLRSPTDSQQLRIVAGCISDRRRSRTGAQLFRPYGIGVAHSSGRLRLVAGQLDMEPIVNAPVRLYKPVLLVVQTVNVCTCAEHGLLFASLIGGALSEVTMKRHLSRLCRG